MNHRMIGRVVAAVIASGLVISASACSVLFPPNYRDANGQVTASASIDSSALQVGDCIVAMPDSTSSVSKLSVVPCSVDHTAEVFAVGTGLNNDDNTLTQYCTAQFEAYVGISWDDSTLKARFIRTDPSKSNTTDVQCILYSDQTVTQTYKGSQQ